MWLTNWFSRIANWLSRKSDKAPGADGDKQKVENRALFFIESRDFLYGLQWLGIAGCVVILVYSWQFHASSEVWRIFGVGILVAGAALLCGFLLGFIFAIPRVGDGKGKATTPKPGANQVPAPEPRREPLINGNLVEISDWLTKIIVGVGLVELKSILAKLGTLSYYLAPGLQEAPCPTNASCPNLPSSGQVAGMAIIIFYFALGFLMGYVWTMVFFRHDLTEELEEENRDLASKVKFLDPYFLINKAEDAILDGDLDEALGYANQAIDKHPNFGGAMMTKARVLKRKADKAHYDSQEGRALLNQALDLTNQAIALLPQKGEPLYNKACYQALLGADPKEVVTSLRSAFHLKPALRQVAESPDPDLKSVEKDADFIELMSEGRASDG